MYHLGFDVCVPRKNASNFDTLRKRFCKRMVVLHKKIAKQFKHNVRSWEYRSVGRCSFCGKHQVSKSNKLTRLTRIDRAFILNNYTWCESYTHQIKCHGLRPTKAFYLLILKTTSKWIPLNEDEMKVVNNSSN